MISSWFSLSTLNELRIWKVTQIIINQIVIFCFVEEAPGRVSEDIKKEFNVDCFDFLFFSVFLMDVMCRKITVNAKELHQNRKIRNTCTPEKSQKRTE